MTEKNASDDDSNIHILLQKANHSKESGTQCFHHGNYQAASEHFTNAAKTASTSSSDTATAVEELHFLKCSSLNNAAMCYIKLGDSVRAELLAAECIEFASSSSSPPLFFKRFNINKARFRRAQALIQMTEQTRDHNDKKGENDYDRKELLLEEARNEISAVLLSEPTNEQALALAQRGLGLVSAVQNLKEKQDEKTISFFDKNNTQNQQQHRGPATVGKTNPEKEVEEESLTHDLKTNASTNYFALESQDLLSDCGQSYMDSEWLEHRLDHHISSSEDKNRLTTATCYDKKSSNKSNNIAMTTVLTEREQLEDNNMSPDFSNLLSINNQNKNKNDKESYYSNNEWRKLHAIGRYKGKETKHETTIAAQAWKELVENDLSTMAAAVADTSLRMTNSKMATTSQKRASRQHQHKKCSNKFPTPIYPSDNDERLKRNNSLDRQESGERRGTKTRTDDLVSEQSCSHNAWESLTRAEHCDITRMGMLKKERKKAEAAALQKYLKESPAEKNWMFRREWDD